MQARILVVDDRHSLVWYTQRILQQDGFDVIAAFDGAEGLRKAREERPDLIVLDTVMPRMDGFQVFRRLQSDPGTAATPVLFLTIDEKVDLKRLEAARRRKPVLRRPRQADTEYEAVTRFLAKPFAAEAIKASVRALLRSGKSQAGSKPPGGRKPLVLVIDDARSLVRLAERTLKREGFDVITAFDGLEGLRRVREEEPDLIVLDIVMPGLDGFQVLQLVRKHTRTPVIMLTSDHDMDAVQKALDLGADGYVVKPVSTVDLVARVKEKLSSTRAAVAQPK